MCTTQTLSSISGWVPHYLATECPPCAGHARLPHTREDASCFEVRRSSWCSSRSASSASSLSSFAHAETLLPLVIFFRAFPDSRPLTPSDYHGQWLDETRDLSRLSCFVRVEMRGREFMTSRIAPYSANVYLILYDCPGGKMEDTLFMAISKPSLLSLRRWWSQGPATGEREASQDWSVWEQQVR